MALQFKEVLVTPYLARELLSINILNRPVYKNVVRKYAAAIARGEWQLSHESIAISTHPGERLLDGQHRLLAVIEAGQPIMMTICYGAPAESFRVIGSGKTRSKADECGVDRKLMEPINFLCFFHHHRDSQHSM